MGNGFFFLICFSVLFATDQKQLFWCHFVYCIVVFGCSVLLIRLLNLSEYEKIFWLTYCVNEAWLLRLVKSTLLLQYYIFKLNEYIQHHNCNYHEEVVSEIFMRDVYSVVQILIVELMLIAIQVHHSTTCKRCIFSTIYLVFTLISILSLQILIKINNFILTRCTWTWFCSLLYVIWTYSLRNIMVMLWAFIWS